VKCALEVGPERADRRPVGVVERDDEREDDDDARPVGAVASAVFDDLTERSDHGLEQPPRAELERGSRHGWRDSAHTQGENAAAAFGWRLRRRVRPVESEPRARR
jgi:hypothetical protein